MTPQPTQEYEVRIGETEKIIVPDGDKSLTFAYLAKNREYYGNVMKRILDDNLKIPTGEQTASLLHAAYFGSNKFLTSVQMSKIRDNFIEGGIWVANKTLWIPEKQENAGVFVVYDEKGVGGEEELSQGELEKTLEDGEEVDINGTKIRVSQDRKVRFAPRDSYRGGIQGSEDLARNGFVIASYLEGANKLAHFSNFFDYVPSVLIMDPTTPIQRVSAIGGINHMIRVYGNLLTSDLNCHAFGVLDSGEKK